MSGARVLSTVRLNSIIAAHLRHGRLIDAAGLFRDNPHHLDIKSWNLMLSGYARNGCIEYALKLFDEMPHKDVVSWNTMMAGFKRAGDSLSVFGHFLEMVRSGLRPTGSTLATVITASVASSAIVPHLHAVAIRMALDSNTFVGTALISGYAKLKDPNSLRRVFDEIRVKNLVSWTAVIIGYMELGSVVEARQAFTMMPERNVVAWTAMINGYIDNDSLDDAKRCFDHMPEKNVVAWTSMIKGYERSGQFDDALNLFIEIHRCCSIKPNQFTYSATLSVCARCCSLVAGQSVHAQLLKSGLPFDMILSSSLVEMYGKCGDIDSAVQVFESMKVHNLVSWNSMIGCYARHGLSRRALEGFERMKEEGVRPDHVTFICVLTACVHGGLVKEGERYFRSMQREFKIEPRMEHYGCMADLLGRAGQLDEAERLIKEMPFEPDMVVWGALIGGCRLHSSLEYGLSAVESIQRFEKDHPAIYAMMLGVYGDRGDWKRVDELKEIMERVGVRRKQQGTSWVESPLILQR
ncbi:pentatricopeptide repeat-containing protein At4g02750-like [Phoenix dactylifera]|uniref:Pentatricopeptide repeat-containing protein At4g02750-like n=1 Tax=Phoenix dactylifera TaxID=42345 RepID=A0A8B9AYH3_PHODC|nr:pentatricopeptide repeat-containing protein At4g02750-like [Phoenix dactylifera]